MVENIGETSILPEDTNALGILALAFVGDSIWEVYVRNFIVANNKTAKVNKLHLETVKYVKAKAQAGFVKRLKSENIIDEALWEIVLRGRNGANKAPKNADVQDYNYATGFEALIGYLYVKKEYEKLDEIAYFCLH